MSKAADYEARATELITPILEQKGFELVDLEYVKEGSNYFLRAYIDKPGGITIDDCELVSRSYSDITDKDDFIPDAYILEISSPGLDRPLKKDRDFERHKGDEVEIRLYKPMGPEAITAGEGTTLKPAELKELAGCKELTGILGEFDAEGITVIIDEHTSCRLQRANLALIRPAIDF